MKKNLLITLGIIVFGVLIVALGCIPKILKEYEAKSIKIVKNNCKTAVQNILDIKELTLLEQETKDLVEKYNKSYKNPFTKKETAFTTDKKCMGCVNINYDKNTQSVTVTGYDKDLDILCRTIVKPPSFVTYEREEK